MVMPCAFELARTETETRQTLYSHPAWESLKAVREGNVYLFDGLIPSRHGPRVIDVLEGLAEAMHPGKIPRPRPSWSLPQGRTVEVFNLRRPRRTTKYVLGLI